MDEPKSQRELVLTACAAEAVISRAAHVAALGMPLASGLRVAASETDSRQVRRALIAVATELERGRSLAECLAHSRKLPRQFRGAIAAAQQSGAFSPLLVQWLEDRRASRQRWRGVVASLSYPLIAVTLACLVFLLFALFVIPVFGRMYDEFGLKLPAITLMTLWAAEAGSRIMLPVLGIGAVSIVVLRLIGGAAGWSLLVSNLPLIGLPWHWTGVAELLRLLSLLVEHQVSLPDALRLTADSSSDAYLAEQCRLLAGRVEQGTSLTMALVRMRTLPLSIVPLVHWGERHGALAEALRSAAEMIEGRVNMRTDMLVQVIPPVLMIVVGAMAASMTVGLFLPLISLIQGLV
jgi:type II secretory pathway component PulF